MNDSSTKNPILKLTQDGSHTLYSTRFDQYYHNPNGAVAESKHNFFEVNGLMDTLGSKEEIAILEVGFGTGLNLLLLIDALQKLGPKTTIRYYSIEAFPIKAETAKQLNFGQHLHHPELAKTLVDIFSNLRAGLNTFALEHHLTAYIFNGRFADFAAPNLQADFIFHDAFSPNVNPELWVKTVFRKLKSFSAKDCILSTYCAASKAKGAMAAAGWHLAKAPGALGKREMTVASLNAEKLAEFERVDEVRLARRYEEDDF